METTNVGANNKYAHNIRKQIGSDVVLYTGPIEGEMWVSNSYWAIPVRGPSGIAALWGHETPMPGQWMTGRNDKSPAVTMTSDSELGIASVVKEEYKSLENHIDLHKVSSHGYVLCANGPDSLALPIYSTSPNGGGEWLALNPGYLDLIVPPSNLARITQPESITGLKPVCVWRALKTHYLNKGLETSWDLAGILMPVRPS